MFWQSICRLLISLGGCRLLSIIRTINLTWTSACRSTDWWAPATLLNKQWINDCRQTSPLYRHRHVCLLVQLSAKLQIHRQRHLVCWLVTTGTCLTTVFGVDAGEVQMSESASEEHLGTKPLLKIWDELPQDVVKKSITSFRRHLSACINTGDGHFEHSL